MFHTQLQERISLEDYVGEIFFIGSCDVIFIRSTRIREIAYNF